MRNAIQIFLTLIIFCSFIGILGGQWWFADLFNHFRPQAIVAALLLALLALRYPHPRTPVLVLIILVLNSVFMAGKLFATQGISATVTHKDLRLISANVLTSNSNHQALVKLVTAQQPDVLVLTEVNAQWLQDLGVLEAAYPYTAKYPSEDNFGMAAYSKKPFKADFILAGDYGLPIMRLDFSDLTVFMAHPIPPMGKENAAENRVYLAKLAEISAKTDTPTVIAGDLNATLWSFAVDPILNTDILKRINPIGFAYTWPSMFFPLAIQIDHFFAKDIKGATFDVLPSIGSDHFPIQTDIQL